MDGVAQVWQACPAHAAFLALHTSESSMEEVAAGAGSGRPDLDPNARPRLWGTASNQHGRLKHKATTLQPLHATFLKGLDHDRTTMDQDHS